MHSPSWNNLRYTLAVIRAGSVSAAARELGVNHATVLRRIAAFEAQHGTSIFEKSANGYRLMPGKETLLQALQEVENSVLGVDRLMKGANPEVRGVVRIASTDTICQHLMPGLLNRIKTEAPQLEVELLSNNSHLDFARMEADMFVRPALAVPPEMNARPVVRFAFQAFATSSEVTNWIALKGPLAKSAAAKWLSLQTGQHILGSGSDSFMVLAQMALDGDGIAILPSFVGQNTPGLLHLPDRMPDIEVPIWVGCHQDLSTLARMQAVQRKVIEHLLDQVANGLSAV